MRWYTPAPRVYTLHARARGTAGGGFNNAERGRIFISARRTKSSRRAQKNKTIDKKNYEMREGTVEIIGGTRALILLPSTPRGAGGAESLVTERRNRGWCDP